MIDAIANLSAHPLTDNSRPTSHQHPPASHAGDIQTRPPHRQSHSKTAQSPPDPQL